MASEMAWAIPVADARVNTFFRNSLFVSRFRRDLIRCLWLHKETKCLPVCKKPCNSAIGSYAGRAIYCAGAATFCAGPTTFCTVTDSDVNVSGKTVADKQEVHVRPMLLQKSFSMYS
jgi:hypothetical protein